MLTYYRVCSAFESPSALLSGLIQNFEIVSNYEKYENMVNRILTLPCYYHRKGAKNAKKKWFIVD
jgi:hypothetical protein